MNGFPLLTILTLVPLLGALVVVGLGAEQQAARALAGAGVQPRRAGAARWRCGTVRLRLRRPSIRGAARLDSDARRRISRRRGRLGPADGVADGHRRAAGDAGFVEASRTACPALLRAGAVPAGRAVRHVHRAEFLPLVHLLGTEPDPGVLPHQTLGRAAGALPPRRSSSSTRWSAAWRCCWPSWPSSWRPASSISSNWPTWAGTAR